jgi:hypothetical protein
MYYDNVGYYVLDQSCRTSHEAVTENYGAVSERRLAGESRRIRGMKLFDYH